MNLSRSRGWLDARSTRQRTRVRSIQWGDFVPNVQIRSTGQPISIVDSVVSALVLAASLSVLAWALGFDPRNAV